MSAETTIAVELRKLSSLLPDPRNVKQHTEEQIGQIVASIQAFGFRDPIGIDTEGNIIEGHGRYLAARRLLLEEVPVLVIDGLSERDRLAYGIAHNQTGQNVGLDSSVVRAEFNELLVTREEFAGIGFTDDDVLFMSAPEPHHEGRDHNGAVRQQTTSLLDPVVRSTLTFDTHDQQREWGEFIIQLRLRYVHGGSISERMAMFVDEYGSLAGVA